LSVPTNKSATRFVGRWEKYGGTLMGNSTY